MAGGLGNGLGWVGLGWWMLLLFVCCFVSVQVTGWHGMGMENLVWLGWAGLGWMGGAVRDGSWDGMGWDGLEGVGCHVL